jgi:ABC-2 type transport system permease protein
MTSEGAIFDLDYRRYEGERTGRTKIRWTMVRDGVRKVLGLRRKARRKILPWGLIIIAVLPAVAIVGFQVFTQGLGADELLEDLIPGHADYFGFTFQLTFLFIAIAAPELLVPDRVSNVLTVYGSRPLTVGDYLIARVGALLLVVLTFTLLPQAVIYLGGAVLSGDIIGYLTDNISLLWKLPAGALAVFATQAGVALIISAFARRRGIAAGIYIGFAIISSGVAFGLAEAVNRWFAVIDLQAHAIALIGEIFNERELIEGTVLAEHNISDWVSLGVVLAIATLAAGLLYRRYRRIM